MGVFGCCAGGTIDGTAMAIEGGDGKMGRSFEGILYIRLVCKIRGMVSYCRMIKWHPRGGRLLHPLEHDTLRIWSDKLPLDGCLPIWLVFCVSPVNNSIENLDNYLLANERLKKYIKIHIHEHEGQNGFVPYSKSASA